MASESRVWLKDELFELEEQSRCMITIANLDPSDATLHLYENSGNEVVSMKIQQSSGSLVIVISIKSSCDPLSNVCEKILKNAMTDQMDEISCTLKFSGTETTTDNATLTCNDVTFDLDSEFDGKKRFSLGVGIQTVKLLSAEGVGTYQLTCPGELASL